MNPKILLIEDNPDLVRVLERHLGREGLLVEHASDGEAGLEMAVAGDYALIILDINLPKLDGLQVLSRLREQGSSVLVMMLSSRREELDKIVGLDTGADDYVTKPFSAAELLSRIKALLRRADRGGLSEATEEKTALNFDTLCIDLSTRRVTLDQKDLDFTTKEFDLLAFLASHPGEAFSHDELLEEIWEYQGGDYSKAVKTMIMRIRRKLEKDPAEPRFVRTVWGYGYRFADESEL